MEFHNITQFFVDLWLFKNISNKADTHKSQWKLVKLCAMCHESARISAQVDSGTLSQWHLAHAALRAWNLHSLWLILGLACQSFKHSQTIICESWNEAMEDWFYICGMFSRPTAFLINWFTLFISLHKVFWGKGKNTTLQNPHKDDFLDRRCFYNCNKANST